MSDNSIKSLKYVEKFSKDIIINHDNLKEQCTFFIRNIEKNSKKYKDEIEYAKEEFDNLKTNKKEVIFTPENLLNISPITILDAPWGTGKTFFIESLCKYILKGEIKLDYIKKIIVIDSWKYSISSTIPSDFIIHLVENLAATLKWKNKIKMLFINFLNSFTFSILNGAIGLSFKIGGKKLEELPTDKIVDKLNKHIKVPILVIIDNIERIGENGWEILKTIQRLAMLNNLIFVLPMNKNKLVNEKLTNSEWRIEKYINIPFYTFKQDYIGLLKKYNIKDDLTSILNDLLSTQINGECLSIRELDKIFSSEEHVQENFKNKYKALIYFKEIWPLEQEIKSIIFKDIEEFIYIIEGILNDVDGFNNLFNSNEFINIAEKVFKYGNLDVNNPSTLEYIDFLNNMFSNKRELIKYCSCIESIKKINFDEIISENSDLKKEKVLEVEKNNIEIEKIDKKIKELTKKINKYESGETKKTVHNNTRYNSWQKELTTQQNAWSEWNQKNQDLNTEIGELTTNINEMKELKEDFSKFIEIAEKNISNMCEKFKNEIKSNKNMLFIFKTMIQNIYFWDEYQSNGIDATYSYFVSKIEN